MIHGYHLILPAYGFWLPNDPRGSWSDFVGHWELACFGKATHTLDRRDLSELTSVELQQRDEARKALKYPPVQFTGLQAVSIGAGFADTVTRGRFSIWACAILPEHTHVVVARHRYSIEQTSNLLKGNATRFILKDNRHPLAAFAKPGERPPRMWAERQWKVYLDSEQAIDNAIAYVNENPIKEGKPAQHWKFVTPFEGLPQSGWLTY